jgi:hypothetical protein
MGAVFLLNPHAEQGKAITKAVDCPQGADKTAEGAEDKHRRQDKGNQQSHLKEKEAPRNLPEGGVEQDQGKPRFQGPRRTEEFAKKGFPVAVGQEGRQRQGQDRYGQDTVLQQRQPPGKAVFTQLGGWQLVQEFLDKAEGTEEAADPPAKG